MKKYLLILFVLIGISNTNYAQQTRKTITAGVSDSYSYHCGPACCGEGFLFAKDGTIEFEKNPAMCCRGAIEGKRGTYFIDEQNVVHITWDNGFSEKGTISYDNEGLISFTINGKTYKDWVCR